MMKEKGEGLVSFALISFLLVMGLIGWAKYFDEKKDVELWQTAYFDTTDDLLEVTDSRDDIDAMRMSCVHDRDICKSALDAVPVCIVPERIEFLEGQLESCNRAYAKERNRFVTQCGWDMCACNDGFEGCPIYVLEYYIDQAVCKTDQNCKNCMWQMVDNGGGLDHDEILWCLKHAYRP